MNRMLDIMNQTEAADYINERGITMGSPKLSAITSSGAGPKHKKKGNQKLFHRDDVDEWIESEKQRLKSQNNRSEGRT